MKKLLLTIAILLPAYTNAMAQTGIITTICGNDVQGYSGDYGPAVSAQLNFPAGICIHGGNIYFCDAQNSRIRMIDTTGTITTVAGSGALGTDGDGGPAILASLYYPQGVAVDAAGNIFIADPAVNTVREVDVAGNIHTIAGIPGIDSFGYNGDSIAASASKLFAPFAVAVDAVGNIYIADAGNHLIRKINPAGIITNVAGDTTGRLGGYSGDGGPATNAHLNFPTGIALDEAGNIFIADFGNNAIRKVSSTGIITTIAGNDTVAGYRGDGGLATAAELNQPVGLTTDKWGNVYIADQGNNRIRKIDTAGIISLVAGDGVFGYTGDGSPAINASMRYPAGVALDTAGNLYISDNENFAIRIVANTALGVKQLTTVKGHIAVYPDPATAIITVQLPDRVGEGTLIIRNATGQTVKSITTKRNAMSIDIADLSDGVYLISYSSALFTGNTTFVKTAH